MHIILICTFFDIINNIYSIKLGKGKSGTMKINWKVRFRNKAFLLTFIPFVLSFIYQILSIFNIFPKVTENTILYLITQFINALALLGIIVDGTTQGIGDSKQALTYEKPSK